MLDARPKGRHRGASRRMGGRALCIAMAVFACGDPMAFEDGPLGARRMGSAFLLENRSGGAVSYVVVEEQTTHVIDLAPCEEWPFLRPGQTRLLPFDQVTGYDPDSKAVFFWCRLDIEGRSFDSGRFELSF